MRPRLGTAGSFRNGTSEAHRPSTRPICHASPTTHRNTKALSPRIVPNSTVTAVPPQQKPLHPAVHPTRPRSHQPTARTQFYPRAFSNRRRPRPCARVRHLSQPRDPNLHCRAWHADDHKQKQPREPCGQSHLRIHKVGLRRKVVVRPFQSGKSFRFSGHRLHRCEGPRTAPDPVGGVGWALSLLGSILRSIHRANANSHLTSSVVTVTATLSLETCWPVLNAYSMRLPISLTRCAPMLSSHRNPMSPICRALRRVMPSRFLMIGLKCLTFHVTTMAP